MGTHPIFESDFDCLTEMSESFESEEKIKDEIMFFLEKGPKSRLEISLNFEKIDDETKIDANLDELDKSGKITHDSDVYSIVNTKAEKSRNEPQIIEAATGGGKVIVEIEERLLNKLDRGELMLISKPKDGV